VVRGALFARVSGLGLPSLLIPVGLKAISHFVGAGALGCPNAICAVRRFPACRAVRARGCRFFALSCRRDNILPHGKGLVKRFFENCHQKFFVYSPPRRDV
jgi:hypothetical protein